MKTSSASPLVVGIGELLWDLLPSGRQLGGAPANFAWHASQLGARGFCVSAVGRDEAGRDLVEAVAAMGLDTSGISILDDYPTGTVSVTFDARQQPVYVIHQPAAWDAIPLADATRQLAAAADAICVGSLAQRNDISQHTIRELLRLAKPGCLRVFDINLRQNFYNAKIIRATLEQCDLLKLNDEEWPILAGMLGVSVDMQKGVPELLRQWHLRLIALTCGARGSLLASTEGLHRHQGPAVTVKDTVGAGDSFTATLVTGLLAGRPIDFIHRHAADVAAYVCTQSGATPKLPPLFR